MSINSFRNQYYFLSNFYNAPVTWKGLTYKNNEAAFQSAKSLDLSERQLFCTLPPNEAKRKGRHINLRPDWEQCKIFVMEEIVLSKFSQNINIKNALLATGDNILIEGNTWNDTFWGMCNGQGQNWLGIILMVVRNKLRNSQLY